ncbi:MAG: polysaccharide deacetylase family protein [Candidatus Humimicrobiaceae bacterium]
MKNEKAVLKNVFLTFDDGPNEPYTSQILDILKKFHARASFFVCGKNAQYYPQVIRKIVKEDHIIANHTYSHSRFLTYAGLLSKEIEKTKKIIQEITSKNSNFFRPPWGIVTPWLKKYLKIHNYKLVLWDVEAHDWRKTSSRIIVERVLEKVKPNSIILLHDGKETYHQSDRLQTVNALPLIINKLREKGYKFEGIDKLEGVR